MIAFRGIIKDGKWYFDNREHFDAVISNLNDGKYRMILEPMKSRRSNNQNAYWHGVCFPAIAELTGYTETEAKEICIKMFIPPKILNIKGKEIEVRKGTSELSKSEGVEFTDSIRQLAVELGGYIPTPCEAGYFCGRLECKICNVEPAEYPQENALADKF